MGMKCYYEILNVAQDASDDDLKRSYRKLALKWHPDKNLDNAEEAKEQFQSVQQAYEVLSDPQERAWYDKHRDSILKGGLGKDYNDDSLNLYPYFSTSCFKGYGDDEKGFYFVYKEVFNKIAAEDSQFDSDLDSEDEIPDFGDSKSPYEDKVHSFYSYWQSYVTKKSFSWLDEYDTRQAPNRRVARLMEKENKKVRDAARKERNEQVRTLVTFVRKRDRRAQEFAKLLEQRAAEQAVKIKQLKLKQRQQREEEIEQQKQTQSEWSKFSNFEKELKEIEESLAVEFNEELSEESCSNNDDNDYEEDIDDLYVGNLYCSACNKLFKTEQAFVNHEKSKKHREKVEEMPFSDALLETPDVDDIASEDEALSEKSDDEESEQCDDSPQEIEVMDTSKKNKKKKKKNKMSVAVDNSCDSENEEVLSELKKDSDSEFETRKFKSKRNKRKLHPNVQSENKTVEETGDVQKIENGAQANQNNKGKQKKNKLPNNDKPAQGQQTLKSNSEIKLPCKIESNENVKIEHICKACTISFKSNNELFRHLKKTGHAVPISVGEKAPIFSASKGKKKAKK